MYRTIDCSIWSDPWFAELRTAPKLLFIYLFTNPRTTPAGTCEISARQIAFDTDIDPSEVGAALAQLSDKVAWWPDLNVVWIRNFYRRQAINSHAEKYRISAIRALATVPREVRDGVTIAYPELLDPMDTLSIPYPMGTDTLTREEAKQSRTKQIQKQAATTSPAPAKDKPPLAKSTYATTLNGALPKLVGLFQGIDSVFTAGWLEKELAAAEAEVGSLSREQLGRGLDIAVKQLQRQMTAKEVRNPRPYAHRLIVDYLTEQRDEHHAA